MTWEKREGKGERWQGGKEAVGERLRA